MDLRVLCILIFLGVAHAHTCSRCVKSKCEKSLKCAGSKVLDVCKCCEVCAKQVNESCGGLFESNGKCDQGLVCVSQPENGKFIERPAVGVCKAEDTVGASENCQLISFYGCNAVNGFCNCRRTAACSNPFQYQTKSECQYNIFLEEKRHQDCANEGCEVRYSPKCPEDSEIVHWRGALCCPPEKRCECRPEKCRAQLCRAGYDRVLIAPATGVPGHCCDRYRCKPKKSLCDEIRCPSPHLNITCPSDSVKLTDRMSKDGCCELPPKCECKSRDCPVTKCAAGYRALIIVRGNARPGTCCDIIECIQAREGVCRSLNGTEHKDGEHWALDACRECDCRKGITHCRKKECPQLPECDNVWTPPGKCCPRCKVTIAERPITIKPVRWCTYENKNYPPGATWKPEDCKYCVCGENGYQCRMESCQKSCEHPRKVEGECCGTCDVPTFVTIPTTCPSMESCKLTGKECPFGFKSDDFGCRLCECRPESDVCPTMANCDLDCPHGFVVNEIGCKKCKCAGKTCKGLRNCKKECPFGYRTNRNGCRHCRCRRCMDVVAHCDKECKFGREMNDYGCEICKCRATANSPRGDTEDMRSRACHDDDVKRDDGEAWTTSSGRQCVCRGGVVLCDMIKCSVPHCDHPVFKEGFLCPVCPDSAPESGDRLTCGLRVEGESWKSDECTSCVCNAGRVMCTFQKCAPLACATPVYEEGHCCPTCPVKPSNHSALVARQSCNLPSGDVHAHGSSWRRDECTSCTCDDGQVSCFGDKCPQENDCLNPVIKRGQCCPQCLNDTSTGTCIVGDREFTHGEVWAMPMDPCTSCSCGHGNALCRREICPPIEDCETIVRDPGKCCGHCADDWEPTMVTCKYVRGNLTQKGSLTMYIGIAVGSVVILCIIIASVIYIVKRRSKNKYVKGREVKAEVISKEKN